MKPVTLHACVLLCSFLLFSLNVNAHDLVIQDSKVISVSPCDRQIRLTVRHDLAGHKHLAGKSSSGPYRIEIYSQTRKKKILDIPVAEHDSGETLFFVVPSQKLICDSRVRIIVDAGNSVKETNEKNNLVTKILSRPKSTGLIENCPVDPDQCQ